MSDQKSTTFSLGVTGGIGSGKTVVCNMFAALGARVVYADLEAKKLMAENEAVRAEIINAFGTESYLDDGRLNRVYLSKRVFGDETNVAIINSIVHPRMDQVFYEAEGKAASDGIPLLVYEAALIYESGSDKRLDAVAVVHAPETTRLDRVLQRDGATVQQVEDRMRHQLPPSTLLARADYVIENTGSLDELEQTVKALYNKLIDTTARTRRTSSTAGDKSR